MSNNVLKDDSPMPWGKHKGTAMVNVPASYLLYFYDKGELHDAVKTYVQENEVVLRLEVLNQTVRKDDNE